jgi:hypothetical protein
MLCSWFLSYQVPGSMFITVFIYGQSYEKACNWQTPWTWILLVENIISQLRNKYLKFKKPICSLLHLQDRTNDWKGAHKWQHNRLAKQLIPGAEFFLRRKQPLCYSRNTPPDIENKGSLPRSKVSITGSKEAIINWALKKSQKVSKQLHKNEHILRRKQSLRYVRNSLPSMVPKGSLPCTPESATGWQGAYGVWISPSSSVTLPSSWRQAVCRFTSIVSFWIAVGMNRPRVSAWNNCVWSILSINATQLLFQWIFPVRPVKHKKTSYSLCILYTQHVKQTYNRVVMFVHIYLLVS